MCDNLRASVFALTGASETERTVGLSAPSLPREGQIGRTTLHSPPQGAYDATKVPKAPLAERGLQAIRARRSPARDDRLPHVHGFKQASRRVVTQQRP
jgi:hypothetical protein